MRHPEPPSDEKELEFDAIADSKVLAQFARMAYSLTGLVFGFVNPAGTKDVLPCRQIQFNKFCRIVRRSRAGRDACLLSDHEGKVKCSQGPCVYECHAGLTEIGTPVTVRGRRVATLLGGQVLTKPPTERGFRSILKKLDEIPVNVDELREAYFNTPVTPLPKLRATVDMAALFAGYLSEIGTRAALLEREAERSNIRLARALMEEKFNEPLHLDDVAKVAELSPKYFSRLFAREIGESFVKHLNRIRIEKAKQELHDTDLSVTAIAVQCGFNSVPHFNRVFRSFESMPPTQFRKKRD